MENARLQRISKYSAGRLEILIAEMEDEILEAIAKVTAESQHHKKDKLTFTINHSIKLDLKKNTQEDTISFGVKLKHGRCGEIPGDDAQLELALNDEKGGDLGEGEDPDD